MMLERGLSVGHTTIYRWVQHYASELDKRCRPYLKTTNDSYRVDETYIKVKGEWKYLYRAVDSEGNAIDFLLRAKRDARAAERFFRKALRAVHTTQPRVINIDQNAAYPPAFEALQQDGALSPSCTLRPVAYLNNIIEQDHRFVKRLARSCLGFGSFRTAWRTLSGFEVVINMPRTGQLQGAGRGDIIAQNRIICHSVWDYCVTRVVSSKHFRLLRISTYRSDHSGTLDRSR
jgi:transposase, IS6 family